LHGSEIIACRKAEVPARFDHRKPFIEIGQGGDGAVRAAIINDEGFEIIQTLRRQCGDRARQIGAAIIIDDYDRKGRDIGRRFDEGVLPASSGAHNPGKIDRPVRISRNY
jgi:hypothetical protein